MSSTQPVPTPSADRELQLFIDGGACEIGGVNWLGSGICFDAETEKELSLVPVRTRDAESPSVGDDMALAVERNRDGNLVRLRYGNQEHCAVLRRVGCRFDGRRKRRSNPPG